MAKGKIEPQFHKEFSSGMITNINENLTPQNAVKLALNLVADEEIGSLVSRYGSGLVGAQLVDNMVILGVFNFRDVVGSNHKLLAAINASGGATSVIYDVIGASTIAIGLTASLKYRFCQFLDAVLILNGTDIPRSYNGASVITTGGAFDLANIPTGHKYVIEFLDRIYMAGKTSTPDAIVYSGPATAGAVSWTVGNGTVNLEPEDGGGGITGFGKVPGYLIIFKERSMKRWNFNSAFPESLVSIGTPSQESVINAAGICAFFSASSRSATGFYITNGGRPMPISHLVAKNIKKWIDAIPSSYHANISGWGDENNFRWSIGDVTVDGETYSNVVVRWSVKTGEWVVYSYPTEFRCFSSYVSGSDNVIVGGDDDGQIIEIEKVGTYTDAGIAGTPVNWKLQTHQDKFGYNQIKSISERMVFNTRGAKGAKASVIIDGNIEKPIQLGEIEGDVGVVEIKKSEPLRGNFIEIILEGAQTGGRATIKEIEVPNIEVLDNYK